jgi:hypothetical protein
MREATGRTEPKERKSLGGSWGQETEVRNSRGGLPSIGPCFWCPGLAPGIYTVTLKEGANDDHRRADGWMSG